MVWINNNILKRAGNISPVLVCLQQQQWEASSDSWGFLPLPQILLAFEVLTLNCLYIAVLNTLFKWLHWCHEQASQRFVGFNKDFLNCVFIMSKVGLPQDPWQNDSYCSVIEEGSPVDDQFLIWDVLLLEKRGLNIYETCLPKSNNSVSFKKKCRVV